MKSKDKNYIHPNFNIDSSKIFKATIKDLNSNGIDILNLPYVSNTNSIEKHLEDAVIKGCLKALIRELSDNDAFLNHLRKFVNYFTQESNGKYKINQYDESIKDYAQRNSKELKSIIYDLNTNSLLPYFIGFQERTNKDYIPQTLIDDLIDNPDFKRQVDENIQLIDIIEIPYSSGMEKKPDMFSKSNVNLNIEKIRKSAFLMQNDENKLKIKLC